MLLINNIMLYMQEFGLSESCKQSIESDDNAHGNMESEEDDSSDIVNAMLAAMCDHSSSDDGDDSSSGCCSSYDELDTAEPTIKNSIYGTVVISDVVDEVNNVVQERCSSGNTVDNSNNYSQLSVEVCVFTAQFMLD
jgi:hypothetical protein